VSLRLRQEVQAVLRRGDGERGRRLARRSTPRAPRSRPWGPPRKAAKKLHESYKREYSGFAKVDAKLEVGRGTSSGISARSSFHSVCEQSCTAHHLFCEKPSRRLLSGRTVVISNLRVTIVNSWPRTTTPGGNGPPCAPPCSFCKEATPLLTSEKHCD
jgi:hypothetical protein